MKILFFKKEAKIDIFFIVVVEVYVEREQEEREAK